MTILGFIGFAFVAGITVYFKYRSFVSEDTWRSHRRIAQVEFVNHRLPFPKPKPAVWDYSRGIPPWNTALIIASGFDPSSYRPQPGDSDLV